MNSYNDYSQPLLILDDFMNYLYLSKRIFHQQWEFLATTRGICSRDGDDLQDYKSVRTLDGMSRQGQFIGLTQKAKWVVETIHSPGAIAHCIVHRSGTGSKGNCSPEKKLIGEVIGLFLGNPFNKNNGGRVLEQGFMMTLDRPITTKLDRKKLDQETTLIQHEDSAGILLNGVNHIYGRISVSRE